MVVRTWDDREFVLLKAIALAEQDLDEPLTSFALPARSGLEDRDVQLGLRALHEAGFIGGTMPARCTYGVSLVHPCSWQSGCSAVALIAGGCSLLAAAPDGPAVSAEPSARPAWVTFSSQRHGYSIRHPAGWEVLERPGEFRLTALRPRHPGSDTLGSPDSHKFDILDEIVVIGARELSAGESLEDFTTKASGATLCGPHGRETTILAGEPAELRKFECACGGTQITALHDGRGYLVWVTKPFEDGVLASFAFIE